MIAIHVKNREVTEISIVVVIAIAFAIFTLSAHFIDEIYQFLHQYARLPLTELLTKTVFLWIAGTLWMTYRYWREAVKKQKDLENIISSISPDVLVVVDCDRNIKKCNPSVKRMFGYEIHEVINQKTDFLYFDRRSNSSHTYEIYEILEREGFHLGFATAKKSNGELFPIEIITGNLQGENGAVLLLRDITERKKEEEERHKLEAQLHQAQKMEALGTLAGGVAHDLNNVLSAMLGYPDLLLLKIPEDSPLKKPLLSIKDSGEKAASIVNDLLTLARRGVNVKEVVNLNTIITQYLETPEHQKLRSFHPEVKFEINLASDLLNIMGSPVHLAKTVMNLLSNAAEAMPEGGRISVSSENRYLDKATKDYASIKEGEYVVLTVKDSGMGISKEDLSKIFEPFYTKKVMGRSGTGLGMSVVWGTIQDHQGYIDVESIIGRGTTFKLYFPITRQEIAAQEEPQAIEEYFGNGEQILVVDDLASQREIVSTMLKTLNYNVEAVSSGEEAVNYVQSQTVDLAVLDMIMDTGFDGLETYQKILAVRPHQKAIIASGFSETDRVVEAQRLGAGTFIQKPYTLEKIGIAIKNELSK
jgi:PAS domain S-box-containing protein